MQAYDLVMLIVIGMATIFGAIKGFAWQVASLASVVVSYLVAVRFRFDVAEMISAKPPWNQFLAMLILYVSTSFVIWVGFRLLSGMIDRVRLKEFDRHLGAGFGLAKGAIYCLLITMFAMSLLGPSQQAAICQSKSGYYISVALDRGVGILPQEIHDVVEPYLSNLDDKLNDHAGHNHAETTGDATAPNAAGAGGLPSLSDLGIQGLPSLGSGLSNLPDLAAGVRNAIEAGRAASNPSTTQQQNQNFGSAATNRLPGSNPATWPQAGANSNLAAPSNPSLSGYPAGGNASRPATGVLPPQGYNYSGAATGSNTIPQPVTRTSQNGDRYPQ